MLGKTCGYGADVVDGASSDCGAGADSGGTGGLSAEPLAPGPDPGIELLPRTPATGSGTARRRGSTRRSTSLLADHRGGWVTRPLGPEPTSVSTGSVTGTGHRRALVTHTHKGPSPISCSCLPRRSGRAVVEEGALAPVSRLRWAGWVVSRRDVVPPQPPVVLAMGAVRWLRKARWRLSRNRGGLGGGFRDGTSSLLNHQWWVASLLNHRCPQEVWGRAIDRWSWCDVRRARGDCRSLPG